MLKPSTVANLSGMDRPSAGVNTRSMGTRAYQVIDAVRSPASNCSKCLRGSTAEPTMRYPPSRPTYIARPPRICSTKYTRPSQGRSRKICSLSRRLPIRVANQRFSSSSESNITIPSYHIAIIWGPARNLRRLAIGATEEGASPLRMIVANATIMQVDPGLNPRSALWNGQRPAAFMQQM